MRAWTAILAALLIFCAGGVAGGLGMKWYQEHHRTRLPKQNLNAGPGWNQRADLLKRLERHMKLTAEQRQAIERILREGQDRMKEVWGRVAPEAREEFHQTRERIKTVLNPEQRQQFDELNGQRAGQRPPSPVSREPRKENSRQNPTNKYPDTR